MKMCVWAIVKGRMESISQRFDCSTYRRAARWLLGDIWIGKIFGEEKETHDI